MGAFERQTFVDSDGDSVEDGCDGCPTDANKTRPGVCGCGTLDEDSDGDQTPDCNDECPDDPDKTKPGVCGCGMQDVDYDGDGVADCTDWSEVKLIGKSGCGCGAGSGFTFTLCLLSLCGAKLARRRRR